MPKKVVKMVKLQVPAGKATPAPPHGLKRPPHPLSAPLWASTVSTLWLSLRISMTVLQSRWA